MQTYQIEIAVPNSIMKIILFISISFAQTLLFAQTKADFQELDKNFQKKKFGEFEKETFKIYEKTKALPQKTLLQWAYVSEHNMNYPLAVYLLMFINKHAQQRELKEKVKEIIDNRSLNISGETLILQDFSFQDYAIKYLRYLNLSLVALCFMLLVQMVNNTRKGRSFSYRPIILTFFIVVLISFNNLMQPTVFALVSTENCLGYSELTSASPVVSRLEKGKIVEIVGSEREWTKVRLGNKDMWVKSVTLFNLFQQG